MFSDWDHACGLAHVVRQPHYGGEVALNHDLAVETERGGYHLRLDERIAVLVPADARAEFEDATQPRSILWELAC
jgi:hypothetical protein